MKLTEQQSAVFSNWIRQKAEQPTCQVCQSKEWRIGQLLVAESDSALDDMSVMPDMAQLVCRHCAHVLLFDVHAIPQWNQLSQGHDSRSAIM